MPSMTNTTDEKKRKKKKGRGCQHLRERRKLKNNVNTEQRTQE